MFDFFRRLFPRTPDAPIASPLAQTIVHVEHPRVEPVKPPRPEVVDLTQISDYSNLL